MYKKIIFYIIMIKENNIVRCNLYTYSRIIHKRKVMIGHTQIKLIKISKPTFSICKY